MLVYQMVSLKWLCMIKSPKALPGWKISGSRPRALFACWPWKPEPECWKSTIPRNSCFFFLCVFFVFFLGAGCKSNVMKTSIQFVEDINVPIWSHWWLLSHQPTYSSWITYGFVTVCLRIGYPENSIVYIEPYFPSELSRVIRHFQTYPFVYSWWNLSHYIPNRFPFWTLLYTTIPLY